MATLLGSHAAPVHHGATYESMKHHTSSWQELYDFLLESNWEKNEGHTDHIRRYELWHEGSKLGRKKQPYLKALEQIMRHPNDSKGDWTMNLEITPELKRGKTIADASCRKHERSQLYTHTRAGHQNTHFALFIEALWGGNSGDGHIVVMILTPHFSHHGNSRPHDLLPHMVILFDTHLLVFVVLHHGPAADGHTHPKAYIEVFFPDGTHERRKLHKQQDEWSLVENFHETVL